MNNFVAKAREVRDSRLVIARLFEKPKCKPWDIVKDRRFKCCHGLGEHTPWCFEGMKGKTITLPKFNGVSAGALIDG